MHGKSKMKIAPCLRASVVLLLLGFAAAQKSTEAEVPVENEPHHHLVFENEYVRVFKVEVAPHEATLVHRHKRDYVVVTIGDTEVTNAVVGKEPKKWSFKDGDVTFLEASGEKSFAHKAVNEGDKPFVNYTIEIKDPHQHYEVIKLAVPPPFALHDFPGPLLLIALDPLNCELKTLRPEPRKRLTVERGGIKWLDRDLDLHYIECNNRQKTRFIKIEFY
jgi:hypothetical protein